MDGQGPKKKPKVKSKALVPMTGGESQGSAAAVEDSFTDRKILPENRSANCHADDSLFSVDVVVVVVVVVVVGNRGVFALDVDLDKPLDSQTMEDFHRSSQFDSR